MDSCCRRNDKVFLLTCSYAFTFWTGVNLWRADQRKYKSSYYKNKTEKEDKVELKELSFLYFELGGRIIISGEDQDVTGEVERFIEMNDLKSSEDFLPEFLSFAEGSIVVAHVDGTDVTDACDAWLSEKLSNNKEI